MKHLKHHPINDKFQKLSKLKKEDHTKAKEKKMDGEKYLAETPKKRGGVSKPTNKKLDGEKFLAENASWMPPAMEKELNDLMTRNDEIGSLAKMIQQLREQIGMKAGVWG